MAPTFVHSSLALISSILLFSAAEASGHGHLHGHHVYNSLSKRAPTVSTDIPAPYAHIGCYTDNVASRTLYQSQFVSGSMTEQACVNYCSAAGYAYAGVEYSQECFCGSFLAGGASKAADGDCNMACNGDANQLCGGPSRLNVFHNTSDVAAASGPAHNAGPANWGFLGCYTDAVGSRTLPYGIGVTGGMTVAKCTVACQNAGYLYAGTEYANECFCGNTLPDSFLAPDGLAGCNMVCSGNTTEYCGGPNRLDAFGFGKKSTIAPKWAPQGCYTDSVQQRTLRYAVGVQGGLNNMTGPNCVAACQAAGYTIAGTEYAQECWCDTALQNGAGPATDGCNMACKGDPTTSCGGPDRLNLFKYTGGDDTSSTTTTVAATTPPAGSSTVAATTTSAAATTTSALPAITAIPGNWTYRGCHVDNANGRVLGNALTGGQQTSVEQCVQYCQTNGFKVAGVEYGSECYCGNAIQNGGKVANSETECNMACAGNTNEKCGGPSRMSVYAKGNLTYYAVPKAQTTGLPTGWTYKGCSSDNTGNKRALPYQLDNLVTNLTATACLSQCAAFGFSAASMEYGQQCFCGDNTDWVNSGEKMIADTACSFSCTGDSESLCGGANAMSYYTTTPINNWGQATGNDAGEYRFLIGGVVIPLITSQTITDKVLFTEKHGTGPANSTGAFELDLTHTNDFSKAWRTLHGVTTDVFCSAGLTLPDKAGRVVNIGGWSGDSTFGVRFYWPDRDWQENVEEVAMLDGRWYPGAVQMVNGSILIVGGEDGSNGAPVPTMEVLPTPEGVTKSVYADWLKRTDPNNLYPFLTVLPSGNLAVFYYNEARILDENTLNTVRTLPNIPGAVNNPLGGRTYPLEGTMMTLPQSYPYSDPLTVFICGGSTPFGGNALDNCASIQPEVPGQNWTIERMPDRRVMTCMTALPDGTFLILNGAHQGAAGFGLASDPNHMAVLYDPSKPLYSRFTRMANTTIDRLYHSEAILLSDGRVLVSGSDPEDLVHEQEYRVEVFIPPYLMGNRAATRPDYKFSDNKTDFAYGAAAHISVNSTVGKVSLLRAVSSTHGNSYGQRTLFPQFSCGSQAAVASNVTASSTNSTLPRSRLFARQSGNSTASAAAASAGYTNACTITMPPNGHVAGGPGWWQLFVLDSNGTPSVSKWIRIGGDPGDLGSWPDFPDFYSPVKELGA